MIFHCTHITHPVYPFIFHQCTFGLFQLSATVNNAALNTSVHIYVWVPAFNFGGYIPRWTARSYHNSMFNFLRNHQTFPKQLQHVTAHFQWMIVPISPYLHLLSSVFFYYSHPSGWIMVTLWFWYVFPSLMANDLENFFHVLIWP